jgi:hypothetical protein
VVSPYCPVRCAGAVNAMVEAGADPSRAMNGQVTGHFTGAHGGSGPHRAAQVELGQQGSFLLFPTSAR